MKSVRQYVINITLIISITMIAMYFSLKDNFSLIVDSIMQMNSLILLVCLAWGILITVVWGYSYKVITQRYQKNYSFLKGIVVAFVGTFFNGITPSATGGQFAQAYVLRKQGISYGDGVSILWADFIIYQTSLMIYVTLLFILRFRHYTDLSAWGWIVGAGYLINLAVVVGLYTIALFPAFYTKLFDGLGNLLEKLHLLKNSAKTMENWKKQVSHFTYEVEKLSKDKVLILKVFAINMVRLTLYFSLPYVIALGLNIRLSPSDFIDVLALSSFVVMANSFIPLPGASGGTEVIFQILFYPLLGDLNPAVMLLWRLSSYYVVVVLGAIVFIAFKGQNNMDEVNRLGSQEAT